MRVAPELALSNSKRNGADWRGENDETVEWAGETFVVSPVLASRLCDASAPTTGATLDGAATAWDLMSRAYEAFASRKACGHRELLARDVEVQNGARRRPAPRRRRVPARRRVSRRRSERRRRRPRAREAHAGQDADVDDVKLDRAETVPLLRPSRCHHVRRCKASIEDGLRVLRP